MQEVLDFWFKQLDKKSWYAKSTALDDDIRQRFEATYHAVVAGETEHWRATAEGRLAEVIVLDQFSRNMFRDTAQAFAADSLALALAQEAIRWGVDATMNEDEQTFLYTPFMHSESKIVHTTAMELFADLPSLSFEMRHKAIIDEFGRYPYRNTILNRVATTQELAWLVDNKGF